jgi:DNA-binding transcriptional regulator YhcF (GntR family)
MTNTKTRHSVALRATDDKINRLLAKEKITVTDVGELTGHEQRLLQEKLSGILQQSTGAERDRFLEKIEPIMHGNTKSDIWERNHMQISNAIASHMRQHGAMPTKNDLAQETGISRQTVAKHIKEYKEHPEFAAQMEQFKFMSHKILANVFKHASDGDMKAAKLYFDMVGAANKQPAATVITAQNNYIQINNTILSQENLKNLTAAQLQQIENIVTNKAVEVPLLAV